MNSDDLQAIIAGAQSAALDDSLWEGWAQGIIRKVGSTGGIFGVVDQKNRLIDRPFPFFENIKGFEEYMEGMIARDPQLLRCLSSKGIEVYTDDEHIDLNDPDVRDYMRWQSSSLNFDTHITMTAQVAPDLRSAFSIHFPKQHAVRAKELKAAWRHMLPDIANAMQLGFAMSHLLTKTYWDGAQRTLDGRPAFLLSETGRVIFLNEAAEAIVRGGVLLRLRHGHLVASDAAQNNRLQKLLLSGIAAIDPRGGVVQLHHPVSAATALVELFPVHRARRVMALSEPAALMVIRQPREVSPLAMMRLKEALGLTETEARVAVHLVGGAADDAIAGSLGVAVSTVRTHVRSILSKAQVRTKPELSHLLTMIVS